MAHNYNEQHWDLYENVQYILYESVDPTHVNVNQQSNDPHDDTCDYSGGTETDMVWWTNHFSGGTRGRAYCEDYDDGRCDQFYVELDMLEIAEGTNDEQDEDKTVCHEAGHTLGLTHGTPDDCMISGERPQPTMARHEHYNDHHVYHINNWF
jgi:hypothetical protein